MASREISTYGLIGNPVTHSLSPLMHNTAFKELGVEATYKLFPLEENELDQFFIKLREKDSPIFGLNVTVPYKEKVISYLDELTPFATKAMAVNTITIGKQREFTGFNTDGPGFLAHLKELNFPIERRRIAIIGAGGASRALIACMCVLPPSQRPQSIRIFDIDNARGENLVLDLKQRLDLSIVEVVSSLDDLNIELADCLINATPVGLKTDDPSPVEEELLHTNMLVYDLIYNPQETKLLKLAKKKGAKASNGLGMLFYQGVLAFQHWASIELDDTVKNKMRKSLLKGLEKCQKPS